MNIRCYSIEPTPTTEEVCCGLTAWRWNWQNFPCADPATLAEWSAWDCKGTINKARYNTTAQLKILRILTSFSSFFYLKCIFHTNMHLISFKLIMFLTVNFIPILNIFYWIFNFFNRWRNMWKLLPCFPPNAKRSQAWISKFTLLLWM